MCFFLALEPKNTKLNVLYGSEAIWFGPYGRNKIYTDLIIENIGDNNITSLLLLYPRGFIKYKKKKEKFYGNFEDVSYRWSDVNSIWTKYLKKTVLWDYMYDTNNNDVIVTLKNYFKPDEREKEIRGKVFFYEPNALKIHPYFCSESKISILNKIDYTIFQFDFLNKPLLKNQKRFLRLFFEPNNSTVNDSSLLHKSILLLLNELYLNYYYASPEKVLNTFKERLCIGINQDIPNNPLGQFERDILEKINDYIDKNIGDIIYQSWRLMLFPKKIRSLFNFVPTGNIEPLGGLMNYFGEPNNIPKHPSLGNDCKPERSSILCPFWKRRSYDWGSYAVSEIYEIENNNGKDVQTGESKIEVKKPDIGSFSLFFTGKNHVRPYELLPWIILMFLLAYTYTFQIISFLLSTIYEIKHFFQCIAVISVFITFVYFFNDILKAVRNYFKLRKTPR